jgi:hypothetical protein
MTVISTLLSISQNGHVYLLNDFSRQHTVVKGLETDRPTNTNVLFLMGCLYCSEEYLILSYNFAFGNLHVLTHGTDVINILQ